MKEDIKLKYLDTEIIQLISQGFTAIEIGEQLGMSNRTVEDRCRKLKLMFKANNMASLIHKAHLEFII